MAVHQPSPPAVRVFGAEEPGIAYRPRTAVRVVVFDSAGRVALLHASGDNYYKLPGGGVDPGEPCGAAALREVREETGAAVALRGGVDDDDETAAALRGCVAVAEEWRQGLHQFSYCYVADVVVGGGGEASLTAEELEDGLGHVWMPLDEARRVLSETQPTSELGRCIQERDRFLLAEATKGMGV